MKKRLNLYYGTVKSATGGRHFMAWADSREHALDLAERGSGVAADLEECLRELAPKSRDWVERFYAHQGAEKIRVRQTLAAELEIDSNALRVRLHRIRDRIRRSGAARFHAMTRWHSLATKPKP